MRRAGVKAQNANCMMSKTQELINTLVVHHNGETIIPKLTSFEGTKKSWSYDGDDTCRAFKRQQMYNQAAPTADESEALLRRGRGRLRTWKRTQGVIEGLRESTPPFR